MKLFGKVDFNKKNMVVKTIEVPLKSTDINLKQLEALSQLLLIKGHDESPLYFILHPDSNEENSEATAATSNQVAGMISELTNISVDDVFNLNVNTVNAVQLALLSLIEDIYNELNRGKTKSHFHIKMKQEGSIIPYKRKIEFFLASDIEKHYPSFVYTQCSKIIEKVVKNPTEGLSRITDLIAFLAYVKPQRHELNTLTTKDVNGNTVYDMNKFKKKKAMVSVLSAKDGIRLFNFFLLKQARVLTAEKAFLQSQKEIKENQAVSV